MSSKTRTRKNRTTGTTGSARTLRSVPDHATVAAVRTDAEDKLWAALYARPNSTATDLASAAKIGKSTAGKILAKWHQDGSVSRTAGIAEGGRRAADLWTITPVDADPTDNLDTAQADSTSTVGPDATDTDDTTPTEPTNTAPTDTAPADTAADDTPEVADSTATDAADAEPVTDASPPTAGGTANSGTDAGTPIKAGGHEKAARLAPGALRGMVEDYLREHPGEEFGPTTIAKALGGKSSGAVSNALDKLVEDNTAVKTKDKPRRFALAPSEVTAPAPTK